AEYGGDRAAPSGALGSVRQRPLDRGGVIGGDRVGALVAAVLRQAAPPDPGFAHQVAVAAEYPPVDRIVVVRACELRRPYVEHQCIGEMPGLQQPDLVATGRTGAGRHRPQQGFTDAGAVRTDGDVATPGHQALSVLEPAQL